MVPPPAASPDLDRAQLQQYRAKMVEVDAALKKRENELDSKKRAREDELECKSKEQDLEYKKRSQELELEKQERANRLELEKQERANRLEFLKEICGGELDDECKQALRQEMLQRLQRD